MHNNCKPILQIKAHFSTGAVKLSIRFFLPLKQNHVKLPSRINNLKFLFEKFNVIKKIFESHLSNMSFLCRIMNREHSSFFGRDYVIGNHIVYLPFIQVLTHNSLDI